MKLSIIVPAHNEERIIGNCLKALTNMQKPRGVEIDYLVVLDRCTDGTKKVVEGLGIRTIEKNSRWGYVSPLTEAVVYGISKTEGEIILLCDADIQEIPKDALLRLLPHLSDKVRRISADVRTRAEKWWIDVLMWMKDKNALVNPVGTEPRGAFQLFLRETYNAVEGSDPRKPSFDTSFDLKIKERGWKVKRVREVLVIERRNFTLRGLTRRQILAGRARRKLGVSFPRTLLHSIFRGRWFVLFGYLMETFDQML